MVETEYPGLIPGVDTNIYIFVLCGTYLERRAFLLSFFYKSLYLSRITPYYRLLLLSISYACCTKLTNGPSVSILSLVGRKKLKQMPLDKL